MILIGWDVGIKNLAYCVINYNIKTHKYKIIGWDIIDLRGEEQKCKKNCLKILSLNLFKKLEEIKELKNFEYVIIENQPVLKNPTMKSIQMILFSYFSFKSIKNKKFKDLVLMNASNKLKVYTKEIESERFDKINSLKNKYNRNKKIAILHTELMLTELGDPDKLEYFKQNKKKDDLADSYLMIMYFIKKKIIENK